jgi:hypothetical protein
LDDDEKPPAFYIVVDIGMCLRSLSDHIPYTNSHDQYSYPNDYTDRGMVPTDSHSDCISNSGCHSDAGYAPQNRENPAGG